MKLTAFLLLVAALQVSARTDGQPVSLRVTNVPLEDAITKLKQQTGFLFIYNDKDMAKSRPVTMDIKDATLPAALDALVMTGAGGSTVKAAARVVLPRPLVVFVKVTVSL